MIKLMDKKKKNVLNKTKMLKNKELLKKKD